jgi:hypothetical protein
MVDLLQPLRGAGGASAIAIAAHQDHDPGRR